MAMMIGHNSLIGLTGSILHKGHNNRSGRLRNFEIAGPMERADAKIYRQHQEG